MVEAARNRNFPHLTGPGNEAGSPAAPRTQGKEVKPDEAIPMTDDDFKDF